MKGRIMNNSEQPRNVLVAVDVQNDFITGSLAVHGGDQIVSPINEIAEAIRETDGDVIFTRDWHPASTPHFDNWPVHCVAETNGADFHPDLIVKEEDVVVSKGMEQTDGYSGWEGVSDSGETLEALIAPKSPAEKVRVFIGGLATDYCVRATALDIASHFSDDERVALYFLRDAIRAVGLQPEDEQRAIRAMRDAKLLATSAEEARAMIVKGF